MSKSMEWVYHSRGYVEPALVRKWQKERWDALFNGALFLDTVHILNTKWLPSTQRLIYANPKDPATVVLSVQEILEKINPKYEICLVCRGDPKQDVFVLEKNERSRLGRWQSHLWEELFHNLGFSDILYELNTRWFPDRKEVAVINPKDPASVAQIAHRLVRQISPRYSVELICRSPQAAPLAATIEAA